MTVEETVIQGIVTWVRKDLRSDLHRSTAEDEQLLPEIW